MSNLDDIREKKTPVVCLDGETRYLIYDFNAFAEIEEVYGSYDKAAEQLFEGDKINIKIAVDLFWAGLLHENENITKKEVIKMFDYSHIDKITEAITKAFSKIEKLVEEKNAQSQAQESPKAQN